MTNEGRNEINASLQAAAEATNEQDYFKAMRKTLRTLADEIGAHLNPLGEPDKLSTLQAVYRDNITIGLGMATSAIHGLWTEAKPAIDRRFKTAATLAFNTGRTYTKHGQRIAAIAIDDGVYFMDIDRNLDGFISECPLTQHDIMTSYDRNLYSYRPPSYDFNKQPHEQKARLMEEFRVLEQSLTVLATAATK